MAIITVVNVEDGGTGSLREAIANAQDGDTIKFASSLANKTITLNSQIKILSNITIDGSGISNLSISGGDKTRIFEIGQRNNKLNVTIKDLTLNNGRSVVGTTTDSQIGQGGAIRIHDYSDLILENTVLKNNVGERGGAVYSGYGSSVTARNSTFENNDGSIANDGFSAGAIAAQGEGGGEPAYDSGNGFVKIENSILRNNKGSSGGAVYTLLTPLTIEGSLLEANEGTGDGGAVFTDGAGGKGNINSPLPDRIIIRDSKIIDNKAKGQGGGLFLWLYGNDDEALIENSIIQGNSVTRGGIYNDSKGGGIRVGGSGGKVAIRDTAIANNTAQQQGGGIWTDADLIEIEGSTFSGNQVKTADGKGDIGGALVLNVGQKPVKISNTTFVGNYADRDSGAIWTGSAENNITLSNSIFADNSANDTKKGNVNFQLKDGGGNIVQTRPGNRGPKVTANATYVDDLKLSDLQLVRNKLVHIPQEGSPAIKSGKDAGAYEVGTASTPTPAPTLETPTPTETPSNDFIQQVLKLTNGFRAENNLESLIFNQELASAAQSHSKNMASQDFFSHTGKDGSSPGDRTQKAGYDSAAISENIAAGQTTPESVIESWKNSSGHRANLLNPNSTEIGIGYSYLKDDTGEVNFNHYWTQVFGQGESVSIPAPTPTPTPAPAPAPDTCTCDLHLQPAN
ncbi:MAG: hypothetical protein HC878_04450 [Leptolyngbyaceae cyanobacterium SL_5_14]|nr:hypothetical protein [Leptolyngbyaceae cyanobacterium SL_5_14]